MRTYSDTTRAAVLAAIRRIVAAECAASNCPQDPEFEMFNQVPVTDNDPGTTERVAVAFAGVFGDRAGPGTPRHRQRGLQRDPQGAGRPYTYWSFGGTDPDRYREAEQAGRIAQDIPVNHSPAFAPVIQPTLDTGTQTLVTAALVWL